MAKNKININLKTSLPENQLVNFMEIKEEHIIKKYEHMRMDQHIEFPKTIITYEMLDVIKEQINIYAHKNSIDTYLNFL